MPHHLKDGKDNRCKFSLKSLSQTRLKSRIKSFKAIEFQTKKIKDSLVQLAKTSEDPKTKGEAMCLANYEIENFEFLVGMNIWYNILFSVNSVSKTLQSKDLQIDVSIN